VLRRVLRPQQVRPSVLQVALRTARNGASKTRGRAVAYPGPYVGDSDAKRRGSRCQITWLYPLRPSKAESPSPTLLFVTRRGRKPAPSKAGPQSSCCSVTRVSQLELDHCRDVAMQAGRIDAAVARVRLPQWSRIGASMLMFVAWRCGLGMWARGVRGSSPMETFTFSTREAYRAYQAILAAKAGAVCPPAPPMPPSPSRPRTPLGPSFPHLSRLHPCPTIGPLLPSTSQPLSWYGVSASYRETQRRNRPISRTLTIHPIFHPMSRPLGSSGTATRTAPLASRPIPFHLLTLTISSVYRPAGLDSMAMR
jgi:hypothetical protein